MKYDGDGRATARFFSDKGCRRAPLFTAPADAARHKRCLWSVSRVRRARDGRTIAGDKTDEWLQPACNEMYRVLKKDALMVSFYGWNRVDRFMAAWKNAGFSVVGHLVFTKNYTSKATYVGYRHECAYILAKGRPRLPQNPLPDVLGWKYSGNRHHPTEKPVTSLQPLIESFTHPNAIVLDPFAGSGSTCVAALQSGRRYIGIELLEQYHRAGQQRLAAVQRAMQQVPAKRQNRGSRNSTGDVL